MFYVVLILGLTAACVAGVVFFYALFLEATLRQHKRRLAELERRTAELARELGARERRLEELARGEAEDEEAWPEVVDERHEA